MQWVASSLPQGLNIACFSKGFSSLKEMFPTSIHFCDDVMFLFTFSCVREECCIFIYGERDSQTILFAVWLETLLFMLIKNALHKGKGVPAGFTSLVIADFREWCSSPFL